MVLPDMEELPVAEIRETLVEGKMKYVELTSNVTDVLNPRYLVMFYDGLKVQAAMSNIEQNNPTQSNCQLFDQAVPETWYTTFGENITFDPFSWSQDILHVNFLDPTIPWGEDQDLEFFDIQFPPCIRESENKTSNKNKTIYINHYFKPKGFLTEDIEKFSVDLTEGVTEVVPVEPKYQSQELENRSPRNLSLFLTESALLIGLAHQQDYTVRNGSSRWQCHNSSADLNVGSEEVLSILYYEAVYSQDEEYFKQSDFLSFSWTNNAGSTYTKASTINMFGLVLYRILLC